MWLQCGIIVLQKDTRKESKMSKKVKIHISLANEIYEKGKEEADKLGIPFSTYLSVLIANDTKNKNEKRK
jgi:predicted DNA binding CopG/RHH family protein